MGRRLILNRICTAVMLAVSMLSLSCSNEVQTGIAGPQVVGLYIGAPTATQPAYTAQGTQGTCDSQAAYPTQDEQTMQGMRTAQGTRTTMQPNGLSASWEANDILSLWAFSQSGEKILDNQQFKIYGTDGGYAYFTSVLHSQMPDGEYTYLCCYPQPLSVNGTEAIFRLPSLQDGQASGGADIMVASPAQSGPLTSVTSEGRDPSSLSMTMNRMMHQFRFYVPEDDRLLGNEKIESIIMNFPVPVVGNVTLDIADPETQARLSDGVSEVRLDLKQPIGVSTPNGYQFACLAIAPSQFNSGQSLQIVKAYTDDKIAYFDPIDLKGKKCEPGHSTPVRLVIRELLDYAGIINLRLGINNLGENPRKITLTAPEGCRWGDGGTNVMVYDPGREIQVGETIAIKFETDVESYKAFSNKQITITYDSENARMSETLTMPAIDRQGTTSVSLTVPYLLFEDFSCVYKEGESYGNNSYSESEREQPGQSLDGCMSHTGWNAARYWTTGNSIRINTRYQCVSLSLLGYKLTFSSFHHGRLDTPQLTGLKPGRTVNLKMNFDAGGYLHSTSSADVSDVKLCIAAHTNTGVLDGIPTGTSGLNETYDTSLNDFGTRQDSHPMSSTFGNNDFNAGFPTYESILLNASSSTRLVFYTIFSGSESLACNAEFNVYIDNIKVQIIK